MTTKFECYVAANMRQLELCRRYNLAFRWLTSMRCKSLLRVCTTGFRQTPPDCVFGNCSFGSRKKNSCLGRRQKEIPTKWIPSLRSPRTVQDEISVVTITCSGTSMMANTAEKAWQTERWPQSVYIDQTNILPLTAPRLWCIGISPSATVTEYERQMGPTARRQHMCFGNHYLGSNIWDDHQWNCNHSLSSILREQVASIILWKRLTTSSEESTGSPDIDQWTICRCFSRYDNKV